MVSGMHGRGIGQTNACVDIEHLTIGSTGAAGRAASEINIWLPAARLTGSFCDEAFPHEQLS